MINKEKISQFIGLVNRSSCGYMLDYSNFKNLGDEIVEYAEQHNIPLLKRHSKIDRRILNKLPNRPSVKSMKSIFQEAKEAFLYDLSNAYFLAQRNLSQAD